MTEKEYRALHRLSYSWVKLFIENRMEFYERFEQGKIVRPNNTKEKIFGTLVDTLTLDRSLYPELFVESTVSKPTGHMGMFLDELTELTFEAMDAEGNISKDVATLMENAYQNVAYDRNGTQIILKRQPLSRIMAEFENSPAGQWYALQCQLPDKYLVDVSTVAFAERVRNMLYEHEITREIIGTVTNGSISVYNQLSILFTFRGVKFKSKLDKVIVDNQNFTIQPYDLKTSFTVEDFNINYRKLYYYIQGLLYYHALRAWKDAQFGMSHYQVLPMKFIVAHSACKYDPLIYPMTRANMMDAQNGFSFNGKRYMGLREAVDAIKWHQENDIWKMSRQNYERSGICEIKTYSDYEYQRN